MSNYCKYCGVTIPFYTRSKYGNYSCPKTCSYNCARYFNSRVKSIRTEFQMITVLSKFDNLDLSNYVYEQPSKIICHCKTHGKIKMGINGCPKCNLQKRNENLVKYSRTRRLSKNEWLYRFDKRHGNYDYSEVDWENMVSHFKITIICPEHGRFYQEPTDHLKSGCRRCSKWVSYKERAWLDKIGLPNDAEHRQVYIQTKNRRINVDGFDPMTNTVYLFHGDFWHGNPNIYDKSFVNNLTKTTMDSLYQKTKKVENDIITAGFNLVVKWETDLF